MSAKRRHGPLPDVRGALWVLLQGLHDLTVVQHQSHQLVLLLSLHRGTVDRSNQLQLLQVLEGLRTEGGLRSGLGSGLVKIQLHTDLHNNRLLEVVHGVGLPLQELLKL